jgi:hypothetical protein
MNKWVLASNSQPIYSDILDLGKQKIPLEIFLLHNKQYLFVGILVREPYIPSQTDLTPNFINDDHLQLRFDIHSDSSADSESLLILPKTIFDEPLIVADYGFYENRTSILRSKIIINTETAQQYYFVKLVIPFVAMNYTISPKGNWFNFDLAIYKKSPSGGVISWISSKSDSSAVPLVATF